MEEFVNNLEPINSLADTSEGFIWRLQDEAGDATSFSIFDNPLIISNMSVWESAEHLKNFMFKTHHLDFLKRKESWFIKMKEATHVMWWINEDETPTLQQGKERLLHLRRHGETPYAFTFKKSYSPADLIQYENA